MTNLNSNFSLDMRVQRAQAIRSFIKRMFAAK